MCVRQKMLSATHSVNMHCVHTTVSLRYHHLILLLTLNTHVLEEAFYFASAFAAVTSKALVIAGMNVCKGGEQCLFDLQAPCPLF